MQIGNAYYNCSCVRYITLDNLWLTVGVSVGSGLLLIIIVIIIVIIVMCRRRRNKPRPEREFRDSNVARSVEPPIELDDADDRYYSTIPAAAAENTAQEYCTAGPVEPSDNKQYTALGAQEPTNSNSNSNNNSNSNDNNNSPYYLSLVNNYAYGPVSIVRSSARFPRDVRDFPEISHRQRRNFSRKFLSLPTPPRDVSD